MNEIILYDFFYFHDENKSEAVETHIPRNRDSKTKKPRHRDSRTKKARHRDSGSKTPQHWETETNKSRHRYPKPFFQRTKSHNIEIPRLKNHDMEIPKLKNHDIKFLRNADPYTHWYYQHNSWLALVMYTLVLKPLAFIIFKIRVTWFCLNYFLSNISIIKEAKCIIVAFPASSRVSMTLANLS